MNFHRSPRTHALRVSRFLRDGALQLVSLLWIDILHVALSSPLHAIQIILLLLSSIDIHTLSSKVFPRSLDFQQQRLVSLRNIVERKHVVSKVKQEIRAKRDQCPEGKLCRVKMMFARKFCFTLALDVPQAGFRIAPRKGRVG